MIEHDPWVGPLYASEGLDGQRIAILGYSAWTPHDHQGYTVESVRNVVSGAWSNVAFFNAIPRWFGRERADFYNRVILFEFVPCAIGGGDARYATATPAQAEAGRTRVLRIIRDHRVEKLLVFSRKAWASLPPMDEGGPGTGMKLGDTPFDLGRYRLDGQKVTVAGLRHPQYAPAALMRAAVSQAIALPVEV